MEEGTDYKQSFAQVPCSTAGRAVIALTAANCLHLHAMDIMQAFIQANWAYLPKGLARSTSLHPQPLYGHCASARCLHFTLAKWFKEHGFKQAGFEESVWTRPAGCSYGLDIISIKDLQRFKQDFLTSFDCTDYGKATDYLGCEIIHDWKKGTITIRQQGYIERGHQALEARLTRHSRSGVAAQFQQHPWLHGLLGPDDEARPRFRLCCSVSLPHLPWSEASQLGRAHAPVSQRHLQQGDHLQRPWPRPAQRAHGLGGL
eukprot:2431380-Rhodomonas_salina.1